MAGRNVDSKIKARQDFFLAGFLCSGNLAFFGVLEANSFATLGFVAYRYRRWA